MEYRPVLPPRLAWLVLAVLLVAPAVSAGDREGPRGPGRVKLWLVSPQAATTVVPGEPGSSLTRVRRAPAGRVPRPVELRPGQTITWKILARVRGRNDGLAAFSVDLRQAADNPSLIDLRPGDAAPIPLRPLDRPLGLTNPGSVADDTGYGGTPVVARHGFADLHQIGGAQNTFRVVPACVGGGTICQGQASAPVARIGRGPKLQVASGAFPAPEVPGLYTFYLDAPSANVLVRRHEEAEVPAVEVPVRLAGRSFTVRVAGPGDDEIVAQAAPAVPPPRSSAVLWPPEGAVLNSVHLSLRWDEAVSGVSSLAASSVALVEDDGSGQPFRRTDGPETLLPAENGEPVVTLTSGLEFGRAYAWVVVAPGENPAAIDPARIRRFSIAPLPETLPEIRATRPGDVSPGITLFNIRDAAPGGLVAAVDEDGRVVMFLSKTEDVSYVQMERTGRIMTLRGVESGGVQVTEETLSGRVLWRSPDREEGYLIHHDAGLMPSGHRLLLLFDQMQLPEDRGEARVGDRIVILDRHTGAELWSWRTVDHYALGDGSANLLDWTHGNAAHIAPADNAIYFSARAFSRISRIDLETGEVVYNMGMPQPSGDTDFGFGLFSAQHAPERLADGNLLVYDNGNERVPPASRVVELAFDHPDRPTSARVVWSWDIRDLDGTPLFTRAVGDADRLPDGNTLVTAGLLSRIFEVDPDGNVVWRLEVGDGFPAHITYRAQRLPSLLVACPGDTDGDGDLDLLDLGRWQRLPVRASAASVFPGRLVDMNEDGRLDGDDLDAFVYWMTGPVQ